MLASPAVGARFVSNAECKPVCPRIGRVQSGPGELGRMLTSDETNSRGAYHLFALLPENATKFALP